MQDNTKPSAAQQLAAHRAAQPVKPIVNQPIIVSPAKTEIPKIPLKLEPTKSQTESEKTKVAKTFNCPKCDQLYWAFLPIELEWFNKMNKQQQDEFANQRLNEHLKTCPLNRNV